MVFGKRTCKPNSVVCGHSSRRRIAADTHQRPTRRFRHLLEPPCRIGPMRSWSLALSSCFPPYLVLLRVGFTLPPALRSGRCALTAPFHPYHCVGHPLDESIGIPAYPLTRIAMAVYFLWHWPSTGLKARVPDVIRHTTLRSSDFPPPADSGLRQSRRQRPPGPPASGKCTAVVV